MRIFNKFRGTKGFISTWERVIRFRYMITEIAKKRVEILAFWEKYDTNAAEEAFRVKSALCTCGRENSKRGMGS